MVLGGCVARYEVFLVKGYISVKEQSFFEDVTVIS